LELNHLRYFFVVAREGSFTRAAKILRVQQPTISKMVQRLESQLNLVLFERHKRGVQLTKVGADVYRICVDVFANIDEIQAVSDSERTECQGLLSMGMTDSATIYLLPPLLKVFLKLHPKVRPSIFAGSYNLITNEILDGRVEFGVYFTRPEREDLRTTELVQVPFQLVISSKELRHKSLHTQFVISRDIDYPKSREFPVLEMLKKNRIKIENMIASNNLESQKCMVLQGLGVALLPSFMVKTELSKGTLALLHGDKKFSYSLKLVTQNRRLPSRNAMVFLDLMRRRIGGFM
jgi:DNA-binding transcriptional LysR family regulator